MHMEKERGTHQGYHYISLNICSTIGNVVASLVGTTQISLIDVSSFVRVYSCYTSKIAIRVWQIHILEMKGATLWQ